MEESGKPTDRTRCGRLLKHALFLLAFSFLPIASSYALDAGIELSAWEITAGQTVTLKISVHGSEPSETRLDVVSIPESFSNESGRKEVQRASALSGSGGEGELLTVFTREWTVLEAGTFSLGPFTITADQEKGKPLSMTLPAVILVSTLPLEKQFAGVRWRIADSAGMLNPESLASVRAGESFTLVLEGFFAATAERIECPVPENALLETVSPLSANAPGALFGESSGWTTLATWKWTPLVEAIHRLPAASVFITGGRRLITPVTRVRVLPKTISSESPNDSAMLEQAFAEVTSDPPSVQNEVAGATVDLSSVASRIAELRRLEYRSLFPRKNRDARLLLESDAGLGESFSVPAAAWKQPSVIVSVILFSIAFFFGLLPRRFHHSRLYFFACAFCIVSGILLATLAVSLYVRDSKPAAVAVGNRLYMVPEDGASPAAVLTVGTSLRLLRKAGKWYYAETFSTLRGWIPSDQVIVYTSGEH